ncbi:MAG: A24 family peptidase [Stellaceae bacterium]
MMHALHDLAIVGFAGLMAVAAFEDFRRFTIPNWVTLGVCALWPVYLLGAFHLNLALAALGCAFAVFATGLLLFARGYVGGGDVKLLAAVMLWAGPAAAPSLLLLTAIIGGVLALIILSPAGACLIAGTRAHLGPAPLPAAAAAGTSVPYGIAISAASLLVILPPLFG